MFGCCHRASTCLRQTDPTRHMSKAAQLHRDKQTKSIICKHAVITATTNPLGLSVYLLQYVDGSDG